jgi:hypothetical protein
MVDCGLVHRSDFARSAIAYSAMKSWMSNLVLISP